MKFQRGVIMSIAAAFTSTALQPDQGDLSGTPTPLLCHIGLISVVVVVVLTLARTEPGLSAKKQFRAADAYLHLHILLTDTRP